MAERCKHIEPAQASKEAPEVHDGHAERVALIHLGHEVRRADIQEITRSKGHQPAHLEVLRRGIGYQSTDEEGRA